MEHQELILQVQHQSTPWWRLFEFDCMVPSVLLDALIIPNVSLTFRTPSFCAPPSAVAYSKMAGPSVHIPLTQSSILPPQAATAWCSLMTSYSRTNSYEVFTSVEPHHESCRSLQAA